MDSECVNVGEVLELTFLQLGEAYVNSLGVRVFTMDPLDGSIDGGFGIDPRVGSAYDWEKSDILRTSLRGVYMMTGYRW